jgi:tRNA A37 threonylcarbamoyladenosine dehydratase
VLSSLHMAVGEYSMGYIGYGVVEVGVGRVGEWWLAVALRSNIQSLHIVDT